MRYSFFLYWDVIKLVEKRCLECGVILTKDNWFPSFRRKKFYLCKECNKNRTENWQEKNRDKFNEKRRAYYRKNRSSISKRNKDRYRKRREQERKKRREMFLEVITHYSNGTMRCACCSESEVLFLTIDHIHGGGNKHREKLFGGRRQGGYRFYRWLINNNFPEGYQILCYNCNCGKSRNNGICPHKVKNNGEEKTK